MSELDERLDSLIESRALSEDVARQVVIQEMADEADLTGEDIDDIMMERWEGIDAEQCYRAFSVFGVEAAGELAGLYERETSPAWQPQIREVIPRATYERLQAIKEELSQALAD